MKTFFSRHTKCVGKFAEGDYFGGGGNQSLKSDAVIVMVFSKVGLEISQNLYLETSEFSKFS